MNVVSLAFYWKIKYDYQNGFEFSCIWTEWALEKVCYFCSFHENKQKNVKNLLISTKKNLIVSTTTKKCYNFALLSIDAFTFLTEPLILETNLHNLNFWRDYMIFISFSSLGASTSTRNPMNIRFIWLECRRQ